MTPVRCRFLTGYVLAALTALGIAALEAGMPADSARGRR